MLRDAKVCRAEYFESHVVRGPRHLAQLLQNALESCPVLRDQAFDVLQKERPWAFGGQSGDNVIDDQPTALGITHPLSSAPRRERLARKTSNIKITVWELPWLPTAYLCP